MPSVRSLSRSFAAGEITPELFGRVDLNQFQTGLAVCRNIITLPHGPGCNRAGFEYVLESRLSAHKSRLIPFSFSTTQTMILEFGLGYIRFHTNGQTLLEANEPIIGVSVAATAVFSVSEHGYAPGQWVFISGLVGPTALNGRFGIVTSVTPNTFTLSDLAGVPLGSTVPYVSGGTAARVYQIATPYAEADLFDLHYVQSADVMTLVHPNYPPSELRRLGATTWSLTQIAFTPTLASPNQPTVVATPPTGGTPNNLTFIYKVTALAAGTQEESLGSLPSVGVVNDLTLAPAKNVISWGAVTGASRYNVYSLYQGLFSYLGQTEALTFTDNNITPDTSITAPELSNPFTGANNFPGAVGYNQQRRCFASTLALPQSMWMTRSGTESNLSGSIPARDDDAITFRIAAREANTIRHIVPLAELMLLTSSAEWVVTANGSAAAALTASTLSVQPQGYTGASNVVPVVVSNSALYAQSRGGHLREMTFNFYANGYLSQDISVMAPHLFDFFTILDMAYVSAPYPIVWCVSSNGDLLGLTYAPENKVTGWHHHDTDGAFESVASVVEGNEDVLYAVIKRTINGRQVRYVERMHSRQVNVLTDAFFVDAGATYNGIPASVVSGLYHLEGKTVAILADGAVQPQQVVTNGAVSIPQPASIITIGLPITADMQTLPFSFATLAYGQGRTKNVNRVWLRVHNSSGFFVGPTFDDLVQFKQRTTEPYGAPPAMVTGEFEITPKASWNQDGFVCVRQIDPLPLIVASMTIEATIGG